MPRLTPANTQTIVPGSSTGIAAGGQTAYRSDILPVENMLAFLIDVASYQIAQERAAARAAQAVAEIRQMEKSQ